MSIENSSGCPQEEQLAEQDSSASRECSSSSDCGTDADGNYVYSEEAEGEEYRRRHRSRRYRLRHRRRKAKALRRVSRSLNGTDAHEADPTCNTPTLRKIMIKHLREDIPTSKRSIEKAAEEEFKGKFNVICSKGDFGYISHSNVYCQAANVHVTCYAFLATRR